jgi:hypothetical protein
MIQLMKDIDGRIELNQCLSIVKTKYMAANASRGGMPIFAIELHTRYSVDLKLSSHCPW